MIQARTTTIMLAVAAAAVLGCDGARNDAPAFLVDRVDASAVILDGETRLAMVTSIPSRRVLDVRVPSEAVLRFAIAVRAAGESGHWPPIDFRIVVDDAPEPLYHESIARNQAGEWLDREVDLGPWAGRMVTLGFETAVDGPGRRIQRAARRAEPLWAHPVVSSRTYRADRPDVVLVSIDCLRADHVGAYGYPRATTPNLDALAAEGTVFEAATSVSSWTLPTHLSLLTGLMPSVHGVRAKQKLGPEVDYLPELLARAGYRADGVASWYFLSQSFGLDRGFHSYKLLVGSDAEEIVDVAIDRLRRAEGTSHFLFVHLIDPHWPYQAPGRWLTRFGRPKDISDVLARVSKGEPPIHGDEIDDVKDLYDAEIAYADHQLGRLLDELDALDAYDDTLIVVTADHGEAFYEHGHWEHTVSLYQPVTHVPLIVKWPRGERGVRVLEPVSQTDVFATILEAAGVAVPEASSPGLTTASSRPIVSELTAASGPPEGCDGIELASRDCVTLAARRGAMKYIATLVEKDGALSPVSEELYDLHADPMERNDLSRVETSTLETLAADVRAFLRMARTRAAAVEEVELDDETTERLRSLGYIP